MQDTWARNGHLWHHLGMRFEEAEMLQHGVVGKPDLAVHADAQRLGLDALELDAVVDLINLDAVKHPEKVEMTPRAAIFTIGRELKTDLLLLGDDDRNFPVFHRLELCRRNLTLGGLLACLLERRRAQDRTDMVGPEGRLCSSGHGR